MSGLFCWPLTTGCRFTCRRLDVPLPRSLWIPGRASAAAGHGNLTGAARMPYAESAKTGPQQFACPTIRALSRQAAMRDALGHMSRSATPGHLVSARRPAWTCGVPLVVDYTPGHVRRLRHFTWLTASLSEKATASPRRLRVRHARHRTCCTPPAVCLWLLGVRYMSGSVFGGRPGSTPLRRAGGPPDTSWTTGRMRRRLWNVACDGPPPPRRLPRTLGKKPQHDPAATQPFGHWVRFNFSSGHSLREPTFVRHWRFRAFLGHRTGDTATGI